MNDFEFHRPATIADATRAIAATADGRYLGGGMSLLPAMKLGLSAPTDLVDLSRVDGLRGACVDAGRLHVGAGTTHAAVAASDVVRGAIPSLAGLADMIGDRAVRSAGTLGGSLALADPAACYPAGVLGLGATVRTDRRTIAADDFFTGMYETALETLGPVAAIAGGDPLSPKRGRFQLSFLHSRAFTIYSGSSEIQRQIIGERLLGLPK
jgi:carbon-monoxide dehydrogenase medium subunit